MLSLAESVKTYFSRELQDGTKVYIGRLSAHYVVGAVAQGGYVLGVIVDAVMQNQADSCQPDPIHVSAHYFEPSMPGTVEVRIKEQRAGRNYSNITADLYQKDKICVTTHVIVGVLPDPAKVSRDRSKPTISPPHPYAARIPFRTHPATAKIAKKPEKLTFRRSFDLANDEVISQTQMRKGENSEESGGGFDHAAWFQLLDEPDKATRIGLSALPFLADLGRHSPHLLPSADHPGESWTPTMSFHFEFKVKLSALPPYIAPQTFGVWSTGRFIIEGRHELHNEVWTAPSEIARDGQIGANNSSWREKMFCVARSTQMATTVPMEVNRRKETKLLGTNRNDSEKAKL